MNTGTFVCLLMLFFVFLTVRNQRQNYIAAKNIRKKGDRSHMIELAKNFIGKECLIYTFNGSQVEGVIKDISGNALLVENKGNTEVLNLDFVIRIREYPRTKKGKKKSVVID